MVNETEYHVMNDMPMTVSYILSCLQYNFLPNSDGFIFKSIKMTRIKNFMQYGLYFDVYPSKAPGLVSLVEYHVFNFFVNLFFI